MAELVDQPHSKCGVLRGVWVRVPPGALDVVHYMKGVTMFNNLPDYKKMEYTANRLRRRTDRRRLQDAEFCPICGQDLTELTSLGILVHALEDDHRDIVFPNHRKTR